MKISNEQTELLIEEYSDYINKIINHTYYRADIEMKDELRQVGMIGLWNGINAYYKRNPESFVHREFVDTICAYIRYEMADLLKKKNAIRISTNQWRNYMDVKRIVDGNSDSSKEYIKSLVKDAGLRYDWYLKVQDAINPSSLDATVSDEDDMNRYHFIRHNDCNIQRLFDVTYLNYIIESALSTVNLERDKSLIRTWIDSIYNGSEVTQTQLAELYGLSAGMVGVIINRFVDICCFVRNCEREFLSNPNGVICFPKIAEKNQLHNGKKVPGVRWIIRYRKWRVEITIGKNKSVFVGYFEVYEEAVRARRDAEIRYRGRSGIEV